MPAWLTGVGGRDGRLQPFKTGFIHLAIDMGLPIVPMVWHGAYKNWEKGTFAFKPMTLDIDVLEPIDTSTWKHETTRDHAQYVHDLFVAALREDQKPLANAPKVIDSPAHEGHLTPALSGSR